MADIMNLLNSVITSASEWFVRIFTASGMIEVYIAVLFIFFGIKFILAPMLGSSRGSDRARSNKEDVDV